MNTQVMHLLADVSLHGEQHLVEVERDLMQMEMLLDDAIKKLCASFMAIHQAVTQQQTLNSMLSDDGSNADYITRFEALHGEIHRHVGAAVTGLQFQDMTSQLIRRMVLHLAGLRDVFGALDTNGSVHPESTHDSLLEVLDHISDRVGARCTELAAGVRSTVNQQHMESGEIELF